MPSMSDRFDPWITNGLISRPMDEIGGIAPVPLARWTADSTEIGQPSLPLPVASI